MSILKVARMGHPVLRTKARAIERAEIRKMTKNFEPAICQLAAGILAQIQLLQLRHSRQE